MLWRHGLVSQQLTTGSQATQPTCPPAGTTPGSPGTLHLRPGRCRWPWPPLSLGATPGPVGCVPGGRGDRLSASLGKHLLARSSLPRKVLNLHQAGPLCPHLPLRIDEEGPLGCPRYYHSILLGELVSGEAICDPLRLLLLVHEEVQDLHMMGEAGTLKTLVCDSAHPSSACQPSPKVSLHRSSHRVYMPT